MEALDESIQATEQSLEATLPDDPRQPAACTHDEQTVAATLADHPERATRQNNLATSLMRRYEWIGVLDDLNRAIEAGETAVRIAPHDHPDRPSFLATLGNCIGFLFFRTGSIEDLNRAIEPLQKAVDTMPEAYPARATILAMFSSVLGSRAKETKSLDDLDRTIDILDKAIDVTPQASPEWASRVGDLSTWLQIRGDHTGSMEDIDGGIQCVSGLGSNGAAAALSADKDPYDALQLMESGRGIISGQLMDLRVDLSRLKDEHPELSTQFTSLRDELDVPASDASVQHLGDRKAREIQEPRRREAAAELGDVTASIRDQPGFHDFLLPPPRAELMSAAGANPIVAVNLSNHRSDAFLIEKDRIRGYLRLEQGASVRPKATSGGTAEKADGTRTLDVCLSLLDSVHLDEFVLCMSVVVP
ncbi:hypothetical protein CONLIGDRAFT_678948 [Coniochaeta ligniaria NRRL 30616]|uniref:Tetratricopeptide repeat protein n=1 Tax=Coniochaeta ligniaria NRRL 30616 TaxID=1408157 RepID=A0A1J7JRF5_9PEZI|nr:hypothetical protein CONLIGDRAFT_678948 [Coniochaeta ligniaria NRRL 30616]